MALVFFPYRYHKKQTETNLVSPRDPQARNNLNQDTGNTGTKAFPFVHKECWIFYETDYSILRTAEGLEKFSDLPDTA